MNARHHHSVRPLLLLAALLTVQLSAQAQQPLSVDALALRRVTRFRTRLSDWREG